MSTPEDANQLTKRTIKTDAKEHKDADQVIPPPSPLEKRVFISAGASKTVPTSVVFKLAFFTLSMLFAPVLTYFYALNNIFQGNSTYSAFAAVAVANGLVIAYVVMAALEDEAPPERKTQ